MSMQQNWFLLKVSSCIFTSVLFFLSLFLTDINHMGLETHTKDLMLIQYRYIEAYFQRPACSEVLTFRI